MSFCYVNNMIESCLIRMRDGEKCRYSLNSKDKFVNNSRWPAKSMQKSGYIKYRTILNLKLLLHVAISESRALCKKWHRRAAWQSSSTQTVQILKFQYWFSDRERSSTRFYMCINYNIHGAKRSLRKAAS